MRINTALLLAAILGGAWLWLQWQRRDVGRYQWRGGDALVILDTRTGTVHYCDGKCGHIELSKQ